jgi:hypothetical protein
LGPGDSVALLSNDFKRVIQMPITWAIMVKQLSNSRGLDQPFSQVLHANKIFTSEGFPHVETPLLGGGIASTYWGGARLWPLLLPKV